MGVNHHNRWFIGLDRNCGVKKQNLMRLSGRNVEN